ncbi:hypothetical protein [Desulfomonile tiedjei]|uniref:MarR family transcriptional regulator n=1 Tax=Desulfomonile tiedjei (strain ATCC 49306 / DSM 6799 / DCB-1) TaxID=706587 RepID=I4C9H8_DESTA|nr:hypothetical protein [Desulfomonile tiedjei]AFM26219.1 hypothetical protein Desti_3571 [Desulfomonile tiedjei DSM 6799]
MNFSNNNHRLTAVEAMILQEMDSRGRITVHSLDRVHARTGLHYLTVSEMARRLQEQVFGALF